LDSGGPPRELLLLTEAPSFLECIRVAAAEAFDRYEVVARRPDYLSQVASAFAQLFAEGLRSDTNERRAEFLDQFVREGLAAGSSEQMIVRRLTFLVTSVIAEVGGLVSDSARREGRLWLAGFASGFACDLVFALENHSRERLR
jgi:hypothetical protein